jgi:hypothetical protein
MENADNKDSLIFKCHRSLSRIHDVVDKALDEVIEFQSAGVLNEMQQARWDFVFGPRETILSVAVKITGILNKVIPLELKTMNTNNEAGEKKIEELSENDLEIIKRYLKKIKDAGLEEELGISGDA